MHRLPSNTTEASNLSGLSPGRSFHGTEPHQTLATSGMLACNAENQDAIQSNQIPEPRTHARTYHGHADQTPAMQKWSPPPSQENTWTENFNGISIYPVVIWMLPPGAELDCTNARLRLALDTYGSPVPCCPCKLLPDPAPWRGPASGT